MGISVEAMLVTIGGGASGRSRVFSIPLVIEDLKISDRASKGESSVRRE